MASNSKLSREQKDDLKFFKSGMGKNSAFGTWEQTTVFVKRVSRDFAYVSASYASPDEMKLRKKVGQWHAMARFYDGKFMLMRFNEFCDNVQDFADTVAQQID